MEIAGQWRREWAGAAEYGKVTEGGVTRRVARALEVLNASAPGARVRVMRAAYHATSGPGELASSYMMHSSRRVISSGSSLLQSPTFLAKPIEIFSSQFVTPTDENAEGENYKVTEPDDVEISQPSKWRPARNSLRMPSEESSSTDNISIVDLDSTSHKGLFKSSTSSSDKSDSSFVKRNSIGSSSLLDAPISLSTLKYKSLLNSNNDWNNRRKSYSFEDTASLSPLHETIIHPIDTSAMESSTDSGICKSTEIVNEPLEYRKDSTYSNTSIDCKKYNSIQSSRHEKGKYKFIRDESNDKSNSDLITVQSSGKLTITLPTSQNENTNSEYSDSDRRVKKVEFCKTELHFAAESGKVNIIATDEKPPPSIDFRRRRSAFVPMTEKPERPITLFGERQNDFIDSLSSSRMNSDYIENEDSTAATKGILKNKIPKPKPYLLGENMVFGSDDLKETENTDHKTGSSNVSIINKQLQAEPRPTFVNQLDSTISQNIRRTFEKSSISGVSPNQRDTFDRKVSTDSNLSNEEKSVPLSPVKTNIKMLQMSPTQGRAKTRKLRESDLTYFGIDKSRDASPTKPVETITKNWDSQKTAIDDIFESVRLVRRISSSVCNSEAESDDAPEYMNLPLNKINKYAPVPTPKPRTKFDSLKPTDKLKTLDEQDDDDNINENLYQYETRRSKLRKYETSVSNRSISEPRRHSNSYLRDYSRHVHVPTKIEERNLYDSRYQDKGVIQEDSKTFASLQDRPRDDESPLYVNFSLTANSKEKANTSHQKPVVKEQKNISQDHKSHNDSSKETKREKPRTSENRHHKSSTRTPVDDKTNSISTNKTTKIRRTEKLATPDIVRNDDKENSIKRSRHRKHVERETNSNERRTSEKTGRKTDGQTSPKKSSFTEQHTLPMNHNPTVSNDKSNVKETHRRHHKTDSSSNSTYKRRTNSPTKNYDKNHITNDKHTSRRSEYVINYDDKNGTVSSICKVKPHEEMSRRKKVSREEICETPKHYKVPIKTSHKSAMQQLRDLQRYPVDKKWRNKVKLQSQRTCQIL